MRALVNCEIFTGEAVLKDRAVLIEGPHIVDLITPGDLPENCPANDLDGATVAPGFVDLQVNGGGGVLFNDEPTAEGIRTIVHAHRQFGTTHLLPTFITGRDEDLVRATGAVSEYVAAGGEGVIGIHLEGPFLSPAERGAHDAALTRPMTPDDLALLPDYPDDLAVLVTVAPEAVSLELIAAMADRGVCVSIGHSDATWAESRAAIAAGASSATHLFNAMRGIESREPGVVGAALEDPAVYCGVIVDGHHVHYTSLSLAWRAKQKGRMYLVTDAMPPVGGAVTDFRLGDREILVREGTCRTADGTLAGSVLDMASAVRNSIQHVGIPKDEALRMASTYPATYVGRADRIGYVRPGYEASLVVLDDGLNVRATLYRGELSETATAGD
jgi:N-acetylglucosamine-6-phosphate deacetylase